MLDGRPERQPDEAARQRCQKEETPERGSLHDGVPRVGAQKCRRGARAHQPGFRVDPLEDRGAEVADGVASRRRVDVAGRRRDLPGQPEQERRATPTEGLERSCRGTVKGWIAAARPVSGVELFRAWFAGEAYRKHRHDTYAVGVTDSGVQVFGYRGSIHASTAGQVVVLYPDEIHDGSAGTGEGVGYRNVYVAPSVLGSVLRNLTGRP